MTEAIYYLSKLLPYLVIFPILSILLLLALYLIFKKGVSNNNVSLYGLFLEFNKKDIFSMSLIFLEFIVIIETMFISEFSLFSILFIFTPIVIYGTINLDLINMIINLFASAFLVVMCFLERVFLSYFQNVDNMWYALVLFMAVCIFIIVIDGYLLIRNINNLTKKRISGLKS